MAARGKGRTDARDQGQGRDPRARRLGATPATADREDGARGREGMGRAEGTTCRGRGAGRPRSWRSRWGPRSPLGIQQMPAHHAHHHHPLPIYNIDPTMGALVPPQLPKPRHHRVLPHGGAPDDQAPAAREPRAEPAQMAAAPVAQELQPEPTRGAVGAAHFSQARDEWVRDWDSVPNPIRNHTLPVVLEV